MDVLSADKSAGHASGFDDAIIDELGLFPERSRALVNGMRSSTGAKDGRIIVLTIQADAPFTAEMIARRDDPAVAVHLYRAPDGCALDDPAAWDAANPGIAVGIKSRAYMEDEARRVLATPADQAAFRAFDLNQPQSPDVELIVSPDDVRAIYTNDPPPADGPVFVGLDFGESRSASAAFAIWPLTGLMRCWMAFGDTPALAERAQADDAPYELMAARGELRLYPGRVTPVREFLRDVSADLAGHWVAGVGADQWKRSELLDAVETLGLPWQVQAAEGGAPARRPRPGVHKVDPRPARQHGAFAGAHVGNRKAPSPPRRCRKSEGGQAASTRPDRHPERRADRGRAWRNRSSTGRRRNSSWCWMRERYGRLDGRRGQRRRDDFLESHPLCAACMARGIPAVAVEVDHVTPLHQGGPEAGDNLQALCGPCHRAKTRQRTQGNGSVRMDGVD